MEKTLELKLSPKDASHENYFLPVIAKELQIDKIRIKGYRILRKSIDARKYINVNLKIQVFIDEKPSDNITENYDFKQVANKPPVIIVGAGPAGLFAALHLIESGFKPIILERGKNISERKRDIAKLNREHLVDEDSNYCFGEGGAGTFSDGKLYTRSVKRGNVRRILELLYLHGAAEHILYDSHPHIGTDKLPRIITAMRETIEKHGGEIRFKTRVVDFIINNNKAEGVISQHGDKYEGVAVILATGHSARNIYEILHQRNIAVELKGFAMGVRVEHPQALIDNIQYHRNDRGEFLPAAYYNIATQVDNRGVYSFCMCPGGFIVPSATTTGEVVVNGMSPSGRNSEYANSGIVVEIKPEDIPDFDKLGPLSGLYFQQQLEKMACFNGGYKQTAPAQRLHDFVKGKLSGTLPQTSYHPGTTSSPIHFWLPESISLRLRQGFEKFGKQMHGYLTNEAVVLGVESRTSSPVRIPRDNETCQHIQIEGLFPCGEGAGYSGGIVSSAMDGEKCAENVAKYITNTYKHL